MPGYEARFVVDTHTHITTLYAGKEKSKISLGGGWIYKSYDNSALTLYDMDRYGVDMCVLKPSWPGTTNEMQVMLVDKYPDKFAACCSDQTLRNKCAKGEAEWTIEAAVEEVDAALKTGKFVDIGEFVPRNFALKKMYTLRERLDEFRVFMDLAAKYDVAIDFHEYGTRQGYDGYALLSRLSGEYPNVSIICMHGGYGAGYTGGPDLIRKSTTAASRGSVYLETGSWPAAYFEIPLKDPNVGATQLIWGHDYGNVPQYVTANLGPNYHPPSSAIFSRKWPFVPTYQTDFWGWSLHQIRKIKDWVTQDEIN
ncbi:amidohydrolase family protein, partial [Candidatus Bathyarchaeota archaeon]|nr:amidohydrolase family protein [Candidatus Bathyarchaeota archaeon]